MDEYDEQQFKVKVASALEKVALLLENNRSPKLAEDVSHGYKDKYMLAESLTKLAIMAHMNWLEAIGVNAETLALIIKWSETRNVTLQLNVHEKCEFLRKKTRIVKSDKYVTSVLFLKQAHYTETKVTDHFWKFEVKWDLLIYAGVETEKAVTLGTNTVVTELVTLNDTAPRPTSQVRDPINVNITWLVQRLRMRGNPQFEINRTLEGCRTPRRNENIEEAVTQFRNIHDWAQTLENYFRDSVFAASTDRSVDLSAITDSTVFVPVLPLLEEQQEQQEDLLMTSSSLARSGESLPELFINAMMGEQTRTLSEKLKSLAATFETKNKKLVTYEEAKLLVAVQHAQTICETYSEGVDYIEDMLRRQLIAAIGKIVTSDDFFNYMLFHNRKFFRQEYRPRLFSHPVRRPNHTPEGTVSIEVKLDNSPTPVAITTTVSHQFSQSPMYFSLNASTKVAFTGNRFLHGYVAQKFSSASNFDVSLVARARQFSSFILMVGRIASATLFEPQHAIILQNKDELKIPLNFDTIPTPKEFKDAIESLSPEQQQFCKAFRSMQLESTLFAICVIQIKPQLEVLLKLPEDSLTKEIKLTQDLMSLFITYQIPSDLLTCNLPETASTPEKIAQVRAFANNMLEMIDQERQAEIRAAQEAERMRLAQEENDRRERERIERERIQREQEERDRQNQRLLSVDLLSDSVMMNEKSLYVESGQLELHSAASYSKKRSVFGALQKLSAPMSRSSSAAAEKKSNDEYSSKRMREQDAVLDSLSASIGRMKEIGQSITTELVPQSEVIVSKSDAAPPAPSMEAVVVDQTSTEQNAPSSTAENTPSPSKTVEKQATETPKPSDLSTIVPQPVSGVDYTKVPVELDRNMSEFDPESTLRPTIINPGTTWTKAFQKSLLAKRESKTLEKEQQADERNQTFDLLDAITKSGALSIQSADLHVVVAATHCFEKSLLDTVIMDNVNPITKLENSSLIVASTIHKTNARNLVFPQHAERLNGLPLLKNN